MAVGWAIGQLIAPEVAQWLPEGIGTSEVLIKF
jgi:hypothetical protein